MRLIYLLSVLLLLEACSTTNIQTDVLAVIKTDKGFVKGALNGDSTVHIFKGIPFAAPPVADLRWKAPRPHAPWTDTLACTEFGPSPVQNNPVPFMMWTQEFITPAKPLSEDCLYLNVWTPAKTPTDKLPVLVYIYGGGFSSGSAACPVYDGEGVAKEGVIFVSINYRVGIFGFLAHPDLTAESEHHSSGNYGLLDQHAALQWVHDNIAAFGGDPNRVTIDGQSAGSMSVQAQVLSPLNRGLLQGAIAESGSAGWHTMKTLAEAEQTGVQIVNQIHAKGIADLRNLSADSVLKLGSHLTFGSLSPIVDGYFLPDQPSVILAAHRQNDVPVIAGWMTGDAGLVARQPRSIKDFRAYIKANYKNADAVMKAFPSSSDSVSHKSHATLAILEFAGAPYNQWAAADSSAFYMYEDSFVPTDRPGFPNYGAFHTSDVPYALHTLNRWDRPWQQRDYDMEKVMSAYWANFVKTGSPNGQGLPDWKGYSPGGVIMELSESSKGISGAYKNQISVLSSN